MNDNPTIAVSDLAKFAADLFRAAGVPDDEADIIAASLVEANLRGHDSHGVVRVWDYLRQMERGELKAGVELDVFSANSAILAVDAGLGFGQVQMRRVIERLSPKAREMGVACGTVMNCGHVGRLGEWMEMVAADGLAGLISVNDNGVLQCVAPPGGTAPRISTNPIAVGVPTDGEPLVLDISTSTVANGKIKVAYLAGEECPPGWLIDHEGQPTTDPRVRFKDPRGSILPMGGDAGYKGFGLGMLFDILVGGLSGGFCPPAPPDARATNNVLLVLWAPRRFTGYDHLRKQAESLIAHVRNSPLQPGVQEIRLPGDRGNAVKADRLQTGIPLDAGTWKGLRQAAEKLGVELPEDASA